MSSKEEHSMSLTSMDVEPDGENPRISGKKIISVLPESHVLSITLEQTQDDLRRDLESQKGNPSALAKWLEFFRVSWEKLESGLIRLALVRKDGELRDPIYHLTVLRQPSNENLEPWGIELHILLAPDGGIANIQNREAIAYALGISLLSWSDRGHKDGYWNVVIEPRGPHARWADGQYGVKGPHGILHVHVPPNLHQLRTETGEWR
jgi:hypothetical protein